MTNVMTPVTIINTWARGNSEKVEGVDIDVEEFDIKDCLDGDVEFPMRAFLAMHGLRCEGDAVYYDTEQFPIIAAVLDALDAEFEHISRGEKTGPAVLARAFGYDGKTDYGEWIDYNSGYPSTAVAVLVSMAA